MPYWTAAIINVGVREAKVVVFLPWKTSFVDTGSYRGTFKLLDLFKFVRLYQFHKFVSNLSRNILIPSNLFTAGNKNVHGVNRLTTRSVTVTHNCV